MGLHVRIPVILELALARGHRVFSGPYDPNLVVLRGPGLPGEWDGLLHYVFRASEEGGWIEYIWPCATRPGVSYLRSPLNPSGTLVLEPGQYLGSHEPGLHHDRPALVQVGDMSGRRDNDRDSELDPGPQIYTGRFAANIHDVLTPDGLAGCIGLSARHRTELLQAHAVCAARTGKKVSLTLVVSG